MVNTPNKNNKDNEELKSYIRYKERRDLSPFLVHFTESFDTLKGIITSGEIQIGKKIPHQMQTIIWGKGVFAREDNIDGPAATKNKEYPNFLRVTCLTETPLDYLYYLPPVNKKNQDSIFERNEYGIVLIKDCILKKYQVSPIFNFYNNYNHNQDDSNHPSRVLWKGVSGNQDYSYVKLIMESLWYTSHNIYKVYENTDEKEQELIKNNLLKLLALIHPFGVSLGYSKKTFDFSWMREWRSFNDINLEFDYDKGSNVLCIICNERDQKKLKDLINHPVVSIEYFKEKEKDDFTHDPYLKYLLDCKSPLAESVRKIKTFINNSKLEKDYPSFLDATAYTYFTRAVHECLINYLENNFEEVYNAVENSNKKLELLEALGWNELVKLKEFKLVDSLDDLDRFIVLLDAYLKGKEQFINLESQLDELSEQAEEAKKNNVKKLRSITNRILKIRNLKKIPQDSLIGFIKGKFNGNYPNQILNTLESLNQNNLIGLQNLRDRFKEDDDIKKYWNALSLLSDIVVKIKEVKNDLEVKPVFQWLKDNINDREAILSFFKSVFQLNTIFDNDSNLVNVFEVIPISTESKEEENE